MRPIVDPPATRLDELAGTDRRRMTDNGDQIALAARLHPQHAEAVILVVEGHPLDEAGQVLARRLSGRYWPNHNPGVRRPARARRQQPHHVVRRNADQRARNQAPSHRGAAAELSERESHVREQAREAEVDPPSYLG